MSQLGPHNSAPESNIEIQPFWDATADTTTHVPFVHSALAMTPFGSKRQVRALSIVTALFVG